MKSTPTITPFTVSRPRFRLPAALSLPATCLAGSLALFVAPPLQAGPVPANLGNGLHKLVESNVVMKEARAEGKSLATFASATGQAYISEEVAGLAALALSDDQGRLLVRINLDGSAPFGKVRKALTAGIGSLTITAVDKNYRGVGVMNAYVSVDDVPALAQAAGVRSVILELKPRHNRTLTPVRREAPGTDAAPGQTLNLLGTFFDQGVIQHRVDTFNRFYNPAATADYQGAGLSIACISNSFAANAAHPASLDVTNNDLPGNSSNPVGNTIPVFVLQDDLSSNASDDEGRGMCQIVYKMAPKATVGFATADGGEVGFANNIRGLAGLTGFTVPGQTFAADVICDDVGYFDEPFYEDGIIGNAVDDVAAAGVSYFSSAANDIGINGYESVIRVVPNGTGLTAAAGNTALAGTNINLAGVPTNLYAGGFHNFNPNGLDVAQTVNVAANNTVPTILQWNDPYDQQFGGAQPTGTIYTNTGTYTTAPVVFNASSTPPLPAFTAGQGYIINVAATNNSGFDAIVSVIDPGGATILTQDTGTDERVVFTATTTGQYQISVDHFGTTTGSFSINVQTANISQYVKSDWNLLAFRTDTGAYVAASSLTTNNLSSNAPVEIGYVNRTSAAVTSIQYVLARANTPPAGARVADHIRYLLPGNGRGGYGPQEYFTYNTVTTSGHAMAQGCNGTAAYSVFRPSIPEYFTSPGPVVVYFDKNQNVLPTPEIRLQPRIAAADGANISANEGLAGLGSDDPSDFDVAANFYGTSAAAPHAAAVALLTLEAHGGRRSVTPAQMTSILQRSTFPHDLDPNSASSSARATPSAGKVTLTFTSDNDANTGTGLNDPNSLAVAYTGPSYLSSLVFNPQGTAATGGAVTAGNNGLDQNNAYFSNVYPGLVFLPNTKAFTVGAGSVGLTQTDVTASFSNLAPLPSNQTSQYWTMNLAFPNNNFTGGKVLHFTVGRGVQHSSTLSGAIPGAGPSGGTTTSDPTADLFGGGVLIPEGTVITNGMSYSGTLGDGSTFNGTLKNRIGAGYSVLDGYGFINAQTAVTQTVE